MAAPPLSESLGPDAPAGKADSPGRWASLNDVVRTKTTGLHVPPRMRDGEDRRLDHRDRWIKQSIEVGNITGNRI